MAKFVEPPRAGKVLGNDIVAQPVPFDRLRAVQAAGAAGDNVAVVEEMIGIVRDYVTLADGSSIETGTLSASAIQKLYMFATDMQAGSAADFT